MDKDAELILQDIRQTRVALSKKLEQLEGTVMNNVENALEGTIDNIKSQVGETVENVKETLNPIHLMERHPWATLGTSVAAGCLIGSWWMARPARKFRRTPGYLLEQESALETEFTGYRPGEPFPEITESDAAVPPGPVYPMPGLKTESKRSPVRSNFWEGLQRTFGEEIEMVKKIALTAAVEKMGEKLAETFPKIKPQVDEIVDSTHRKLGKDNAGDPQSQSSRFRRPTDRTSSGGNLF